MTDQELLTGKKIAEKLGVSEGKVKKVIKEHNIEPDSTKGVCKYYGPKAISEIGKALK